MNEQPPDQQPPDDQPDPAAPAGRELRIVGLGASAGGLAALRTFFEHMPADSGLVFVVILHLSPQYESNLAELLQHSTTMPVVQVSASVSVEANHVYVIPPTKYLSMDDGMLHLSDPQRSYGQRVPIDLFFRTLAETHGANAAAIIFSGAGSDGTIGLKRIKECGGVTLVQDPQDAEYDSMPRNAIATNLVDFILPVAQLPQQLLTYWNNVATISLPSPNDERDRIDALALREILTLVRLRTGHDFTNYKRATVLRRIGRRLQVTSVSGLPAYLKLLHERPSEIEALLNDLLISVTNFFRDPQAFAALELIIPRLFAGKQSDDHVRVWVAGCATGEEAYSLAMLLREHADRLAHPPQITVFATDIDDDALITARQGRYLEVIEADVSPERLGRFFTKEPGSYRIKKDLRDLVLFASHNLIRDPPFFKLDLITCRNVLIYLDHAIQEQILRLFHFILNPQGFLFLGASEFADRPPDLFSAVDKPHRLFVRQAVSRSTVEIPALPLSRSVRSRSASTTSVSAPKARSFGELHQTLVEQYAPPSLIVNEAYEILHISTHAGRFLQFSGGEPSYNLLKVIHPDLRVELRAALFRAVQQKSGSETRLVSMRIDEQTRLVNLIVRPVEDAELAHGFVLVMFDEIGEAVTQPHTVALADPVARQLDEELQHTREQLRTTVDQYETTVEDLKASNEELQAINEELRAATEELETSKEELQSVNEELTTVNHELKTRVDEVSRVNSDLQNFLTASDIGTIFLDRSLRIMRYTPRVAELFNLIPADLNRPLAHITHQLSYDDLPADAAQVLEQLVTVEREVQHADGRWYIARLLPYRSQEDKISGVVLTFVDISRRKRAELALRASERQLKEVLDQMPAGVLIAEPGGGITFSNTMAAQIFGAETPRPRSIGEYREWRAHTAEGQPYTPEQLPMARALLDGEVVIGEILRFPRPGGDWLIAEVNASPIRDADGTITGGVITFTDVSKRHGEEMALLAALQQTARILETISDAYINIDREWRCVYMNRAWEQLFGVQRDDLLGQDVRQTFAGSDIAAYFDQLQHALDQHTMVAFDAYYHALEKWVEVRIIPIDDGGLTIYQRDITEQKLTEERFLISEERLRLLNENVQDYALIMLDPYGRVLDWNIGAQRMFGYETDEMLGQDTARLFTPDDLARGVPEQEMQAAIAHGRAEDERWHVRKDGSYFWVSGITTALYGEQGQLRGFWKIARDMTARMQAKAALIESEERLRIALDAAQMGTWDWEIVADKVVWNRQHYRLFGIEPDAFDQTYAGFKALVHPDDRAFVHRSLMQTVESGDVFRAEFRVIWPDGSLHWMADEGRVFRDEAGTALRMIGVVTDVTEEKRAEAELRRAHDELEARVEERTRELAQMNVALQQEVADHAQAEAARKELLLRVVSAEEEERKRISRELHDQLGQQLTALLLGLQTLKDSSHGRPVTLQTVEQLQHLVDDVGREVHEIALRLRPTALDDLGLVAALANHAAEWAQQTQIEVDFHSVGLEQHRLAPQVETTIYRVVLEALTNVIKHAAARRVSIILERRDAQAVAIVEDDGRGFDVEERQGQRLGLRGMYERVALVGGTLTIESTPGAGTTVFVRVPLADDSEGGSNG